jgi:hypothetical protein
MEPIGSGLGLGRGGEQGALVGSKDAQPMREVGGVIGAGFIRDSEIRSEGKASDSLDHPDGRQHFDDTFCDRQGEAGTNRATRRRNPPGMLR